MAEVYKGAGTMMARIVGRDPIMDETAEKLRAKAQARAIRDFKTGKYSKAFRVKKERAKQGGVMDRVVYNDHPDSAAIELGHATEDGRWVPGKFNLIGAINES